MISVSRKQLRSLRSVFRRLAGSAPMRSASVTFTAGPDGQRARCSADGFTIEQRRAGALPHAALTIPFGMLAELEGNQDDPVCMKPTAAGVVAEWTQSGVSQQRRAATAPKPCPAAPALPATWSAVSSGFAEAFADAGKSVADGPARYALHCIALRGKAGQIAATDGKQLFIADGFAWPWDVDLLVPATTLFAAKELAEARWNVGRTDDHVVVAADDWTIWLPIDKDRRFPDVDHITPAEPTAVMSAELAMADAAFLKETLPRLPGKDDEGSPVTVHCNGHIAVRAKGDDHGQVTELLLTQSTNDGAELAFAVNRDYLARAVALGCRRLLAWQPDRPILAIGSHRRFLWQPLTPSLRVDPVADAVRIASPVAGQAAGPQAATAPNVQASFRASRSINNERTKPAMQDATATTRNSVNGQAGNQTSTASVRREVPAGAAGGPIAVAEALKTNLRTALANLNELLVELRRQRKQSQLVQSTLESLKSFERVA